ncbi:class I adenylate-forming enzyme family protein [Futiania mangrovi]|uniref:Acyl--CoA ligase n=1 Tax=Futiania mangrovi TaxID=2959716 RepID=A0A9J6P7W3_9PROT|nr:class I adenylate-forming enzyme family protein [Futiania mangrovii]MCP1335340.1 acyl--CoA ligase [Futiania mangrovii]
MTEAGEVAPTLAPPVPPAPHGAPELPIGRFRWLDEPVRHWAGVTPERVAVGDGRLSLSYSALDAAVDRMAERLAELGVQAGDRVTIVLENSVAGAVTLLACARMRAWAVPLNARLSDREIDAIADHCGPRVMVFTDAASHDARHQADRLGAAEDAAFGQLGARVRVLEPSWPEPVSADPVEQVAALIYTSGTTGAPKGVMLTHDNLVFVAGRSSVTRFLNREDRVYGVLPMSHVFGLASVLCGTLYQGARLDAVARFQAEECARALAEDGVTIYQGVPQMHARLVSLAKVRGAPLPAPRLRYMSSGGAPLDIGLKIAMEAMWGQPLHNGYGLTETSPTVTTTPTDAPARDASSGKLMPDVEVRIADPETGAALAPGAVGEIQVRGRLVMKGYYRDPAQTEAVMTADGFFRSGDLGRMTEEGELYVVGRLKELIIRSGFNVYPPEVEAVLTGHPDVAISAVVGKEIDGNEEVVAFLQPVPGRTLDEAELRAFVESRLAPYKRPSRYVVMEELPATSTGKLLKARLREIA